MCEVEWLEMFSYFIIFNFPFLTSFFSLSSAALSFVVQRFQFFFLAELYHTSSYFLLLTAAAAVAAVVASYLKVKYCAKHSARERLESDY